MYVYNIYILFVIYMYIYIHIYIFDVIYIYIYIYTYTSKTVAATGPLNGRFVILGSRLLGASGAGLLG